jgi:hypothetical protein
MHYTIAGAMELTNEAADIAGRFTMDQRQSDEWKSNQMLLLLICALTNILAYSLSTLVKHWKRSLHTFPIRFLVSSNVSQRNLARK